MKKVLVIGAGMVGSTIAADLSERFVVTCADLNEKALKRLKEKWNLKICQLDVRDRTAMAKVVKDADAVVSAVPGFLGFETLKTLISLGKNVVDISFFPEDPFLLQELALKKKVTAIVDCGVAPGLCNILAGYHYSHMKMCAYECLVGGLPVERKYPYEYKAVFSPADVIEEYVRPARYVQNGKPVTRPALTDIELVDFEEAGTLEAFNTDGLRTLAVTMPDVPDMKEKTMRYPGHAAKMHFLRTAGFFSTEETSINGVKVKPLSLTSKILFKDWEYLPGDEDRTIMRVTIAGEENGETVNYQYDLLDRFDARTGFSSMSRTTGFTCCAAVELLSSGKFNKEGICPAEYLGEKKENFKTIISFLEKRNVKLNRTRTVSKKSKRPVL